MKITEDNYIKYMKRGQEDALWYFIENHGWIVKSIIQKKMAAYPSEQEDCLNRSFMSIWTNAKKYNETKASFITWAVAVTKYEILNYMRCLKIRLDTLNIEDIEVVDDNDITSDIYYYDEKREFQELLECLPAEDQELFMQIFWEEQSYDEISSKTGMKKHVLYNRISRGKKKLRESLKGRVSK